MSTDYFASALEYYKAGYMSIPLTFDGAGFPKRPIPTGWTALPYSLDVLKGLDWAEAKGIGILLGSASKGLAVIDIDDEGMADAAAKWTRHTRTIRTVRGRCHVYLSERRPSKSKAITVTWRERAVKIELKCQGAQVAAPPTPGYSYLSEAEPKLVDSIGQAWAGLARVLGIKDEVGNNGYPKPWRPVVPAGERDMSAYVEAHMLREARMPLDLAVEHMRYRWERHYEQGGQDWDEIARTVESAYSKGAHPPISDVCTDIEWT